jgi:VWFA-related protein
MDVPRLRFMLPLTLVMALHAGAQQAPATNATAATGPAATLHIQSDLVLTNVVVRDKKTGAPVKGLTRDDFTVLEDGKPQQIVSFDHEDVNDAAALAPPSVAQGASGSSGATLGSILAAGPQALTPEQLNGHRLIVLFIDTTSLQPDDIERVQDAARHYVQTQMQPADIVAVASLGNTLSVDQDFTQSKPLLLHAIDSYSPGGEQGFTPGATSTTNQVEDTTSFTPDEEDYNDLNTDRELFAIASIAHALAPIREKKSLIYFSGGISRDGIENQASLRAAINASVRANLAIYSIDARGLQAVTPLGDATTGSLRGTAGYNGAALQNNLDSNFNSQEVMATLSSDTGGKSFFDNNDFSPAFERVQQDTASYYVIGFRSTNLMRDGRYRKLQIGVRRNDVKLEYRPGYYAPADFQHSNRDDRERDLEAQLTSDLPATDVSLYLQPFFFRADASNRYTVPVSLLVPGSQIPFTHGGSRDKATLDVIGLVKDAKGQTMGQARDTVKLAVDAAQQVSRKNIQYTTSFTLPPGAYHLKFVVRENETGKMGSFETGITVPDLGRKPAAGTAAHPIRLSSLVLASQELPSTSKKSDNPLIFTGADGKANMQLVPNLPHVFHNGQSLYFLYEVYDPATTPPAGTRLAPGVHLLTSIELLQGTAKVFETPLVEAHAVNVPGRDAVAFQFTVPLTSLKDGLYTCQVNVIDDTGGTFSFPRTALLVRGGAVAPAQVSENK